MASESGKRRKHNIKAGMAYRVIKRNKAAINENRKRSDNKRQQRKRSGGGGNQSSAKIIEKAREKKWRNGVINETASITRGAETRHM